MEIESSKLTPSEIAKFLAGTDLFKSMDLALLEDIAAKLTIAYLPGGDVLIQQHETAENLYIVMYGRLRAVREMPDGNDLVIREIGPGTVIGEIAMLSETTRTATVYAIRDSVLLKMSKEVFNYYVTKNPAALISVTKTSINRLVSQSEVATLGQSIKNIVVIPAGNNPSLSEFVTNFSSSISSNGSVLYFNQHTFDERFGKGTAQLSLESDKNSQVISWLQELENKHKYIIFEAEANVSSWTLRCLRQADHILLVGQQGMGHSLNDVERLVFKKSHRFTASTDLIILHEQSTVRPLSTELWLSKRPVRDHYNIRMQSQDDYKRLGRLITGHALGLVLSGGGARGFAHAGVLRALEEAGIKIDYIGGSSMGSLIAGMFALGYDYKTIYEQIALHLSYFNKSFDYTLPLLSLSSGKRLSTMLRNGFGEDVHIEDLWEKFFCVSTNISKGSVNTHLNGLLWRSIRASLALPAIFPPIQDKHGDLLVDGAIMNCLPVDVMRSRLLGGRVIASSMHSPTLPTHYNLGSEIVSGWRLLFTPRSLGAHAPNIAEVVMASMLLSSNEHQEMMAKEADFCININPGKHGLMDFKSFQKFIDIGYDAAVEQLANMPIK